VVVLVLLDPFGWRFTRADVEALPVGRNRSLATTYPRRSFLVVVEDPDTVAST
jgi:hypothetical protein